MINILLGLRLEFCSQFESGLCELKEPILNNCQLSVLGMTFAETHKEINRLYREKKDKESYNKH